MQQDLQNHLQWQLNHNHSLNFPQQWNPYHSIPWARSVSRLAGVSWTYRRSPQCDFLLWIHSEPWTCQTFPLELLAAVQLHLCQKQIINYYRLIYLNEIIRLSDLNLYCLWKLISRLSKCIYVYPNPTGLLFVVVWILYRSRYGKAHCRMNPY